MNRFFPSSKTCSSCHWIKDDLKLKDRKWECRDYGILHDRDKNAANMILKQGKKYGWNARNQSPWTGKQNLKVILGARVETGLPTA